MKKDKYRFKRQLAEVRKEYNKIVDRRFDILIKREWTEEDAKTNKELADKEIELLDRIHELEELETERAFNEDWKVLFFILSSGKNIQKNF